MAVSLPSLSKVLPTADRNITEEQKSTTESTLDASQKPSESVSSSSPSPSSGVENLNRSPRALDACPTHTSSPAVLSEGQQKTLEFSFGCYVGEVHPENPQLRHGEGRLVYSNGNVYTGHWKDGAPDGFGEKQYVNGDTFVGFWVNGKREGRGSYLFQEGHIFEGMYVRDNAEGYGTLHTIEDDRYSGGWKNGLKDGVGIECLHTGEIFTGTWRGGKKVGAGALRLPGSEKPLYGMWDTNSLVRELTPDELKEWKETVHHPEWVSTKEKSRMEAIKKSGRGTAENEGESKGKGNSLSRAPQNTLQGGDHLVPHAKENGCRVPGEDPIVLCKDENEGVSVGMENDATHAKKEKGKTVEHDRQDEPCDTSSFSPPTISPIPAVPCLSSLQGFPPPYLPGERGDDWDEEFERNSSDDERDAMAMHANAAPVPHSSCDEKEQLEIGGLHDSLLMRETFSTEGATADTTTATSSSFISALDSHFSSASTPWMNATSPSPSLLQNLSASPHTKLATLEQSILSMEAKLNLLQTTLENAMKDDVT